MGIQILLTNTFEVAILGREKSFLGKKYSTRSHGYGLNTFRLEIKRRFLTVRELLDKVVGAKILSCFKIKLNKFMKGKYDRRKFLTEHSACLGADCVW